MERLDIALRLLLVFTWYTVHGPGWLRYHSRARRRLPMAHLFYLLHAVSSNIGMKFLECFGGSCFDFADDNSAIGG